MSAKSAWKEALREPNAWAWIAVLVLVLAIGAGTVIFAGPGSPKMRPAIQTGQVK